jgi:hypothetical protein
MFGSKRGDRPGHTKPGFVTDFFRSRYPDGSAITSRTFLFAGMRELAALQSSIDQIVAKTFRETTTDTISLGRDGRRPMP